MGMSKQEFIEMANFIAKMPLGASRDWVYKFAVHMGIKFNPQFNEEKFKAACFSKREGLKEANNDQAKARIQSFLNDIAEMKGGLADGIVIGILDDYAASQGLKGKWFSLKRDFDIILKSVWTIAHDAMVHHKSVDEIVTHEGLRAGGIKLISLSPLREIE